MPAKSQSQERLMNWVKGVQEGKAKGPKKIQDIAKEMTPKQVNEYSGKIDKSLPERVKAAMELTDKHYSTKGINKEELNKGIAEEKEHTPKVQIRKQIALDHLKKIPKYYTELDESGIETDGEKQAGILKGWEDNEIEEYHKLVSDTSTPFWKTPGIKRQAAKDFHLISDSEYPENDDSGLDTHITKIKGILEKEIAKRKAKPMKKKANELSWPVIAALAGGAATLSLGATAYEQHKEIERLTKKRVKPDGNIRGYFERVVPNDENEDMSKKAYIEGFVKEAQANGLTEGEAIDLYIKQAEDPDSSFLGRYLASKEYTNSVMANKRQIMDDIDPTGEKQEKDMFMFGQPYKDQRQKAYDYLPQTLKRYGAGPIWKNLLLGGGLGGGFGALIGALNNHSDPAQGAGIGALIGAPAGAALQGLDRVINKYEQRKITPEDIKRIKQQQLNKGFLADLVPGRDIYDAAVA